MRIPDEYLKCVVFVGIEDRGDGKPKWYGTGFFVSLQSPKFPNKQFVYLVTARHVIAKAGIAGRDFNIRVNSKDGTSTIFKVSASIQWFYHPDESAACDVAVYPLIHTKEVFESLDFVAVPFDLLMTDAVVKSKNIGVGDDVIIAGLFAYHSGVKRNAPIVRTGNIAMMPEEPIPTSSFGNMEVYLIEARSIGGLSGSPVFVLKPVTGERYQLNLFGLVHGHWDVPVGTLIESELQASQHVNVGVAMVVPAKKISETIGQPALEKVREKMETRGF